MNKMSNRKLSLEVTLITLYSITTQCVMLFEITPRRNGARYTHSCNGRL